jgi:hypothetical protein
MEDAPLSTPPDLTAMLDVVSSIFAELNVGLLIFHLEDAQDPCSLRLVYVNRAASDYTHGELSPLVGKLICDAFPGLTDSELPALYTEVARTKQARNFGATPYQGDANVERGYYAVKAFPMPGDCVGIVFENITVRKQVEELVRRQQEAGRPGQPPPGQA